MKDHDTNPTLRKQKVLIEYAHSRRGKTMSEIVGWWRGELRTLADSMDLIGWRRFMEGMISKEVLAIQRKAEDGGKSKLMLDNWGAGQVTKLFTRTVARKWKETLQRELEYQIALGGDGLAKGGPILARNQLRRPRPFIGRRPSLLATLDICKTAQMSVLTN
jgi:hypothetical protein